MSRPGGGSLLLLLLLGAGWGLHVVLTKALGAQSLAEALALFVVYVSGTATGLVAVALLRGRFYRPRAGAIRFFAISSSLGYLGPILAELVIAPRIDAGVFALIAGATPVATVAIAAALGLERLGRRLALALCAGTAAAVVLVAPGIGGGGPSGWIAAAFVVPLLYGADNVYIERAWPKGLDTLQVSAGEGIVAAALCALLALAFGVGPAEAAAAAAAGGWLLAALIAISLASVLIYFHLVRTAGAVFVSFASYVAIAAGVAAGILVFGERPGGMLAAAAALLGTALWLLHRDRQAEALRQAGAGGL